MKTNYAMLSREELVSEQARLHKKLMWPNLVVLIISLIAALTLFFGTLLSIDVHVNKELADFINENMSSESTSTSTDGSETGEEGSSEEPDMTAMVTFMLQDVDMEISISFSAKDAMTAAFASDKREGVKKLVNSALPDLKKVVDTLTNQAAPALLGYMMMASADKLPEDMADADLDVSGFEDTLTLLNDQKEAEAKAAFLTACNSFAAEQLETTLTAEDLSNLSEMFDETVDMMKDEEGTIAVSNLIFSMADMGSEEGETTEEGSESSNSMQDILALLEDPSAMIDELDDDNVDMINLVCLVISVLMLVCAGCWAILALFALLHIFIKNKKLGMWYVKLTGFIPFAIFFVVPLLALKVLPNVIPDMPAAMQSLPIAFGSLTFISAICLLVLWIVSIFWCHPIKKRIKRCKKALRHMPAAQ